MVIHFSTRLFRWQSVALAVLAATSVSANDTSLLDRGSDNTSGAVISRSLTDETLSLDASSEFVSSRLSDVLADEPVAPCTQCGPVAKCDCKTLKELKAKVAGSHKGLFYENKFDYLCDPCYDEWHLGDILKRQGIGDWITLDIGGEFRLRQHAERNMRGLGLTGRDDDFLLNRTRLYSNIEVGNFFRFYAEGIDANSEHENYSPRPIEVNRTDMLNLFGDFRLLDVDRGSLWARVGRQELLYGDQRFVSPLDWANTRRTFDGYKLFWSGEAWDADVFYTRPVTVDQTHFDSPNLDQEFMGTYLTYKNLKNNKLDFYYLAYNNFVNDGSDFSYDTYGAHLRGNWEVWLWDVEGAYQTGDTAGANHDAEAFTVGLGRNFECVKWTPTLWAYYDWASGDEIEGNGYHHMFPLAHKYLGFMDFYGRSNVKDANLLLTFKPHQRVKCLMWYHMFRLENINDVPYNVTMSPFNPGNQAGSKDLGSELDTSVTFSLTPRADLTIGYSHFFAGDYYATTPNVPYDGDASFLWTQFQLGF